MYLPRPKICNEPLSFAKTEAAALGPKPALGLPELGVLLPAHRRPAEGCGHTGSPLTSPHQHAQVQAAQVQALG